ncbi:MAG: TolC family protein [Chlamydiota bacterium]
MRQVQVLLLLLIPFCAPAWVLSRELAEEIALGENPLYLASHEKVYQSVQKKWQAVADWCPKVVYESFYAYTFEPTIVEVVSSGALGYKQHLNMNKFGLSQPVFSSDLLFDLDRADLGLRRSQEENLQKKNQLLFSVRKSYYATLLAALQVETQKENIGYLQEALAIEKKRYESAVAPPLDVTKSAVASSNAISLYYQALKKWVSAKNALVQILGLEPAEADTIALEETSFPLKEIPIVREKLQEAKKHFCSNSITFLGALKQDPTESTLSLFSEEELRAYVVRALEYFPEIQLEKIAVDLQENALKKAYGKYFPHIATFIDYQKNAGDPGARTFSEDSFSWAAGVKLSWNLFDSFGRERKIKEAASKKIAAKLRYKYAALQTEVALRDTLRQIEEGIYAYLHAENAVFFAKKAMEQAKERLLIGTMRPLDYRDSVNEFSQAQYLRNEAAYQTICAYYQLTYLSQSANHTRQGNTLRTH